MNCNGQDDVQLCYGDHNNGKALFAVCYNTNTLIPEFTGNKVQHGGTVGAPNMVGPDDDDDNWKSDASLGNTASTYGVDHVLRQMECVDDAAFSQLRS